MAPSDEVERLRSLFDSENPGLSDDEMRLAALRFAEIAPDDLDAWWALANIDYWLLRDIEGSALRNDPRFEEMVVAYRHVIEIDPSDSAAPYNMATCLERAGAVDDAYDAYILAGDTETAHPRPEFEWPAWWHYEHATEVALAQHDRDKASFAAQKAVATGEAPDLSPGDMLTRLSAEASGSQPI